MRTIEASVSVGDDRRLSVQLPEIFQAGEYEVVLVLSKRALKDGEPKRTTTALRKVREALKETVAPEYSLADELIEDRRRETECE